MDPTPFRPRPANVLARLVAPLSSPEVLRGFHGWSTVFWVPFTVLAYVLGWLESVTFVSIVSMVALFLGSFSSWQASRVETLQIAMQEETAATCCEHGEGGCPT